MLMSADMSIAVDAVRLAMSFEQTRAKVAAHNIAMANVPGSQALRFNVAEPLAALRSMRGDPELFAQTLRSMQSNDLTPYLQSYSMTTPLALDGEVAEMSAASGRYQALADGVSRQFALMQLAIQGGR
jgi:flagellar basal-body rod protein FlgB